MRSGLVSTQQPELMLDSDQFPAAPRTASCHPPSTSTRRSPTSTRRSTASTTTTSDSIPAPTTTSTSASAPSSPRTTPSCRRPTPPGRSSACQIKLGPRLKRAAEHYSPCDHEVVGSNPANCWAFSIFFLQLSITINHGVS